MDVQGWITLTNSSGTPYVNASTLLVAGSVGSSAMMMATSRRLRHRRPGWCAPVPQTAARERLGDFYLYPLPERTTIADKQTKQVSFLDVHGAPAHRGYEFRNGWLSTAPEPLSVDTVLRFSSSRDQGLGDALPAGTIRVYQRDARGNPQFVGEHRIGHTPMGSDISLATGQAFDVKVRPVVDRSPDHYESDEWKATERFRIRRGGETIETGTLERPVTYWRTQMRYIVTNASPAPVTVDLHPGVACRGIRA